MDDDIPLWVNALGNLMAFGIPCVFIALGTWMLTTTRRFMANAQEVQATVIEVGETRTANDAGGVSIDYLPTYEYRNAEGTLIEARAFRSTSNKVLIGDKRTLLVDPHDPNVVRYSNKAGYMFAAFGLGLGIPALLTALLYA